MSPLAPAAAARITDALQAVVDRLTALPAAPVGPLQAQSLADGAAGIALLHIERALTATGPWDIAHRWLGAVVRDGVLATVDTSLYRGAPAVAFALHTADADRAGRYATAQHAVDRAVATLTHRRVDQALDRIARAELPRMAEYDVISGLTGIAAHLLRHTPDDDALQRVLTYLVRLTEPVRRDGRTLPGWWTEQDPHATMSPAFPGGHANLGLAHGVTGPLALLALATRRGITVDGHVDAIERICAWLDTWRQQDDTGPWWPQWITHDEHRTGRPAQHPRRPSWCYGTPGVARAQQLAGLAIGDADRRQLAEHAIASCLADASQLARITDISLCHGWAGLLLTVWRAATDAATTAIADRLPDLIDELLHRTTTLANHGDGLLEGHAGAALALHTVARGVPPRSGWDACLLIA